jgi:hypothetical protein
MLGLQMIDYTINVDDSILPIQASSVFQNSSYLFEITGNAEIGVSDITLFRKFAQRGNSASAFGAKLQQAKVEVAA